jgi:enoyl-CoA hydratase/carnithine racemase
VPDFQLLTAADGPVFSIDLNRPEEGNSLTRPMMEMLAAAIRRGASAEDTRVIVIKARGDAFCRGRDGRGETAAASPYERRVKALGPVLGVYEAIHAASVPIVALVQGAAIGFGAALAGACDVTLTSDRARFAFTEILHDIPPVLAMSAVLHNVPPKALSYLIYSADEVGAAEAVEFGLASKVFPNGDFEALAAAFVARLASRPRVVLETVKKFQHNAAGTSAATIADYAGALLAIVRS